MVTPLSIKLLDISDEEYFGENYKDYISNSRLSLINPEQGGSIEQYKAGLGNSFSDSLYFGSCIHCITLQENDFEIAGPRTRPTAKLGFMADILYPIFCKGEVTEQDVIEASNKVDYYKGKMDSTKVTHVLTECEAYWQGRRDYESFSHDKTTLYLNYKQFSKFESCIKSLQQNKEIQSLLHPEGVIEKPISVNEGTLLMDVSVNGEVPLKLKAKLDNFTIDLETQTVTLNDLKTSGHLFVDFGTGSFVKYHYGRQMAMYLWMLLQYVKQEYKLEHPHLFVNMLVVTTIPDYRSGVYRVSNEEIKNGWLEFNRLIELVADGHLTGWL